MWTDKDREKYKDDGRRYPSDLTDAEWDIIKPLFMGYFTFTADMREVVNACFYLEHTGCQWRALPTNFGPHQTVRTWYDRFRTEGVWAQAAADLTRRSAHGHGAEPTTGILNSQSVVSGPQQGERGFDGNKKIKGIKRHVLSCSLGFVLAVVVTPASATPRRPNWSWTGRSRTGSPSNAPRSTRSTRVPRSRRSQVCTRSSSRFPHANLRSKASPRCRSAGASRPPSAPAPTATGA